MAMCHNKSYFNLLFDFELDESGVSTGGCWMVKVKEESSPVQGQQLGLSELKLNVLRLYYAWPSNCLGAHGANRQNSQYEPM